MCDCHKNHKLILVHDCVGWCTVCGLVVVSQVDLRYPRVPHVSCQDSHSLIELRRIWTGGGAEAVIRWCEHCGAIVVDRDYDGHTDSGHYRKMELPSGAEPAATSPGHDSD